MGGRGASSGRSGRAERRNRVNVGGGDVVQATRASARTTPAASTAARTTTSASNRSTRTVGTTARATNTTQSQQARTTPQQTNATQRKPRLTQARAQTAAEASFSRSSWGVESVRKSNGTWTVFVAKKAYGDGYEARGEVRNGRILNDEMGMGERALDFARRTGAKKVVVIGYAD